MSVDSLPPPIVRPIDRIQQVLSRAATHGTFATRHTAEISELHLDVVGVGAVPLPLSSRMARKLCEVAKPARYGLREKTLLDRRVRDTWEIEKRRIKLDTRRWKRTLDPTLTLIARDLGLPTDAKLRAELHNLLLYGPGQFFAPHQDSEKADGMIGSLVVLLPSDSRGGALVVEHHDEAVSVRGSSRQLVLAAFYADCRHEVKPVTSGYRAALTYNLFIDRATSAPPRPATKPLDTLTELVRDHFASPRPSRGPLWPSRGAPERLVYLLDHEYTQAGLSWRQLKSGDAGRAALLREVAARLDCEIVLALADVHETWSCEDDWEDRGWRRRRSGYGRDEDDVDGGDEQEGQRVGRGEAHTLLELCDSDIELRHWVAPSDKRVPTISDEVAGDEICFTKPSVELAPFKSEHEGYTGNAGNTVDRWYHRAAVMLWPRTRTFAIRTKASPAWGIKTIATALARGTGSVARRDLAEVLPFWREVAPREAAPGFIEQLLQVAAEIDDATLAAALVEPIAIERMTPPMAKRWITLLARYGIEWSEGVFARWSTRPERGGEPRSREDWLVSLPKLCAPLCTSGAEDAIALGRCIVRAQWAWIEARLGRWMEEPVSSSALRASEAMSRPIVGLLGAAGLTGDHKLQTTIVERLTMARGYPVAGALAVLRAGAHGGASLGLAPLHEDCARVLGKLLETPPRTPEDWSIPTTLRCKCELCSRLTRFLEAETEQVFEWRLAKDRRAHVHQQLTSYELPVTHVTRRVGSPHTLVLTKTRALFTRDAAARASWARDLAWLREAAGTSTAGTPPSLRGTVGGRGKSRRPTAPTTLDVPRSGAATTLRRPRSKRK